MPGSTPALPLPRRWPQHAADALVHAIAMARVAIAHVHGGFALSPIARVRIRSENERLRSELAQAREQMRLKDARMSRIPPKNRPRCLSNERHAIMLLRAAAGWSAAQTARIFLVTPPTIADWGKALQDESMKFRGQRRPLSGARRLPMREDDWDCPRFFMLS